MDKPITVMLVDDHALLRSGLRSLLELAGGVEVVAEADNGRDAIELASRLVPDVVLIDIGMPGLNGIEATRKIHAMDPKIRILALSMHSDERFVKGILDAGGRGYLLKTCDSEELMRSIQTVMRGKFYVTSDLTHVLVDRDHTGSRDSNGIGTPHCDVLTPREREVLQLLAEGLTSKAIGERLGTAIKTIETHRTNIIRKLDLHSIAELTKYAICEGLTSLNQ